MKKKLTCIAATFFALASTAVWAATPLAVWNGDFNTATTRNGVMLAANNNTVAATSYVTVTDAINAATASDAVVLNLTGETVTVDSITAASLTVNGTGEINVTGDVNVSGTVTFAPDTAYYVYNNYPSFFTAGYTLKMTAANMSAGTLNGAATIVADVTANAGTFYGTINGDITAGGSLTLQGPQTVTGELNITSGTTTVDTYEPSYALHLDASATDNMTVNKDSEITAFTTPNGNSTRTWSSQGTAYATLATSEDYFGGRQAIMFNANAEYAYTSGNLRYNFFVVYQKNETLSADAENVLFTSKSNEGSDKIRFGVYKKSYQDRSKWYGWNNSNSQASNYTWPIFLDGSNTATGYTAGKKSVLSFVSMHPGPDSRGTQIGYDSMTFVGAVAEIIGVSSNVSLEERAAIESHLMQKWYCTDKASFTQFASTAEVTLSNAAVLDLGGLAQTVKSIAGLGSVQNGTLTVTDAIDLTAGQALTLPTTAVYTLGAVEAKVVDGDTVTLYGSAQDAIDSYTSGTLTILTDATVAVGKEVTISGIVFENDAVLTVNSVAPFTATLEGDTLTSTRSAATFVYVGPAAYSAESGNFTIGEAATPAVPGVDDTVQFDTATSIYIGSADITYAAMVLNADVTVTGAASKYLRVTSYTGTGKLILARAAGTLRFRRPTRPSTARLKSPAPMQGSTSWKARRRRSMAR